MKWLSILRQRSGLTQIQLSDKTGIDSNMISRYERGAATPTLETIQRLALGLGVTVDELLNGSPSRQTRLVVTYDWSKYEEGGIGMDDNGFELILGSKGQIGLKGAGLLTSREAMEDFLARVRLQVETAFEAQVKRGAIQGA